MDYVLDLYSQTNRNFLPCHPRDLIGIGLDMAAFKDNTGHLSIENIGLAWNSYFIELKKGD
jgi:hypothetical protein